jgi:hypothetical protein
VWIVWGTPEWTDEICNGYLLKSRPVQPISQTRTFWTFATLRYGPHERYEPYEHCLSQFRCFFPLHETPDQARAYRVTPWSRKYSGMCWATGIVWWKAYIRTAKEKVSRWIIIHMVRPSQLLFFNSTEWEEVKHRLLRTLLVNNIASTGSSEIERIIISVWLTEETTRWSAR